MYFCIEIHKIRLKMKKRVLLSFLMLVPLSLVAQEMEDYKIYEKVKIDNLFYDLFPDFQ